MRDPLARILTPTPLLAAVQVLAVGYFALWGCFNTAAPTLRPVAPFAEDRTTQVGVGLNATTGLLNSGTGSTVYVSHRFGEHVEASGYGEIGTVVPGLFGATLLSGSSQSGFFGGVVGGGGALRLRTDLLDVLSIGLEGQLGVAGVVLPVAIGGGVTGSNLLLGKSYVGVPVSFQPLDWFALYTNPGLGVLVLAPLDGTGTAIPAPQIRLPIGVMFTPTPRYHVLIETGLEGVPLLSSGPYFTVGGAADF